MKKFNILLLVALLLPIALNARKVYEAEKVVNHSFPASNKHTLVVDNKYGKVDIQIWDKNEVSAIITITGMSSRSQEIANTLVNRVKINANASGNTITFRTEITSSVSISGSGTQSNDISYTIKVPRNIAFNLTNKYGDINIDECGNAATIDVKYGNFYCTKMTDKNSNIILGYGNATIQEVNGLKLKLDYSSLSLKAAHAVQINSTYSKYEIEKATKISVTSSQYDNFKINEVDDFLIESRYASIKTRFVNNLLSIKNKYGSVSIDNAGPKTKSLEFDLGYTDLKINIPVGISFEFDITNKYGDVKLPQNTSIKNREKSGSSTTVKGTAGSGNPTLKLNANNSYSDISITSK